MVTAVWCKHRTSTRTSNDRGMSYCLSEIEVVDQFTFHKSFLGKKLRKTFLVFRRYLDYCIVLSHKITFFSHFFKSKFPDTLTLIFTQPNFL